MEAVLTDICQMNVFSLTSLFQNRRC